MVRRGANARLLIDGRFHLVRSYLTGNGAVRLEGKSLLLGLDLELTIDASVLEEVPPPSPEEIQRRVARQYEAERLRARVPSPGGS